jgi:hypothetical protein
MSVADKAKNERMSIYVDCILGIISASIGLIGIIFFTIPAWNSPGYLIGLSFWIFWLILCAFFIALGISTHYANKNFDSDARPRKDLKAPIVS